MRNETDDKSKYLRKSNTDKNQLETNFSVIIIANKYFLI